MSSSAGKPFFEQFLSDYFAESEEHLMAARANVLSLEAATMRDTADEAAIDDLLRNFHSLKGLSAMVGMTDITEIARKLEDYLRQLKGPGVVAPLEGIEIILA